MKYLIFVFIFLITNILYQSVNANNKLDKNEIMDFVLKNLAQPNVMDNPNIQSLLKNVDLQAINNSLDVAAFFKSLNVPIANNNLDLGSILNNLDLQSVLKNVDEQSVNKLLDVISVNKSEDRPISIDLPIGWDLEAADKHLDLLSANKSLDISSKNKDLKLTTENKNLELTPENKNVELAPENKNLELTPENKNVELAPENKNLELTPENKNVELAPENKNLELTPENKNVELAPENKNLELPPENNNLELTPENNNLELTPENQDLELTPENKDLKLTPENKSLELPPLNKNMKQSPENKNVNLQSEIQNLEYQSENQNLDYQPNNQNLDKQAANKVDWLPDLKNLDLGSILGNSKSGPASKNQDLGSLSDNLGSLLKNIDLKSPLDNPLLGLFLKQINLGSLSDNPFLEPLIKDIDLGSLSDNPALGSLLKNLDLGSLSDNPVLGLLLKNLGLGSLSDNPALGSLSKNLDLGSLSDNPALGSLLKNLDLGAILQAQDFGSFLKNMDFQSILENLDLKPILNSLGLGSISDIVNLQFIYGLIDVGKNVMEHVGFVMEVLDNPWKEISYYVLPSNISYTCQLQFHAMFRDMVGLNGLPQYLKLWSLQMIDSCGKPPSGLATGNVLWFGNILECLSVRIPQDNFIKNQATIGEFCMVNVYPNISGYSDLNIRWAFCSPLACSISDKLTLINHYTSKMNARAVISENACQNKEMIKIDSTAKLLIILLVIPIALVLLATLIDVCLCYTFNPSNKNSYSKSVLSMFCNLFSAIPAFNYLFSSQQDDKKDNVDFIFGIRAIFMLIIIWFSTVNIAMEENPWKSPLNINEIVKRPFVSLLNHHYVVMNDVLFLSGFWLSFTVFREKIFRHFSIFTRFILRYIRVTAPYLYVMAFLSGPALYYVVAPAYPYSVSTRQDCRESWFENIFYLTSFSDGLQQDKCIRGEWLLAVEMQLYLLALPIVFLLTWKPKLGLQSMLIVFFASTLLLISVIGHEKKNPFVSLSNQLYYKTAMKTDITHHFNPQSWLRASSCILGILLGYLMVEYKHKFQLSSGFALFTKLLLPVIMFIKYIFDNTYIDETLMPQYMQMFYAIIWNLICHFVLACIIILCYFNPNDFYNRFLSWKYFLPIGKLSVAIYLVNATLIRGRFIMLKDPLYLSYEQLKWEYATLIVSSFMVGAVIYFVVESPLYRIMKKIFPSSNINNSYPKLVKV